MNDQDEFPAYNEPLPPLRPKSGSLEQPDPVTGETTDFDSVLPSGPPPVIGWYKVYAGFMALLYLLTAIGGFYVIKNLAAIQAVLTGFTPEELKIRAFVTLAIGIVLFTSYVTALLLPNTPGVWVFHTILIGVGLSSCCLWPATIPMMIAWLKPETQRWFGRKPNGNQPHDPDAPLPPIPTA